MEAQQSRTIRYKLICEQNVCFVTAMFAHMFIMLLIQNRFHLLLKNLSIRNPLRDVLSAPLFVVAVSIFVACAVEFEVGVLAPEDFSESNLPLRGLTIRRPCVCCSVCMRNGLRFSDSKHCFAGHEKAALHEYFGMPRNKNASWRQTTVWLYGGHHRINASKDESCEFAARQDPRAVHTLRARFARDEIINSLRSALREETLFIT